jgi:hypothetical protein
MGAAEIRTFLLSLVRKRELAALTFNVHAAALNFLYVVTLHSARAPVTLDPERGPFRIRPG